jgi:hypothetical protein
MDQNSSGSSSGFRPTRRSVFHGLDGYASESFQMDLSFVAQFGGLTCTWRGSLVVIFSKGAAHAFNIYGRRPVHPDVY